MLIDPCRRMTTCPTCKAVYFKSDGHACPSSGS